MFQAVPGPTSPAFEAVPGPKSPVFQVVPRPTSPVFQVVPGPTSPLFQVVPGPTSRPRNYENVDLFKERFFFETNFLHCFWPSCSINAQVTLTKDLQLKK